MVITVYRLMFPSMNVGKTDLRAAFASDVGGELAVVIF